MSLIATLQEMGRTVECNVPDLNFGGCCVYAAAVARNLQAAGIAVWGVIEKDWRDITIDQARDKLGPNWRTARDWNEVGIRFPHVLAQFEYEGKVYTHDSNGTTDHSGLPLMKGRLTVEELERLAGSPKGWNTTYKRRRNPTVRKVVETYLGAYAISKIEAYQKKQLATQLELAI